MVAWSALVIIMVSDFSNCFMFQLILVYHKNFKTLMLLSIIFPVQYAVGLVFNKTKSPFSYTGDVEIDLKYKLIPCYAIMIVIDFFYLSIACNRPLTPVPKIRQAHQFENNFANKNKRVLRTESSGSYNSNSPFSYHRSKSCMCLILSTMAFVNLASTFGLIAFVVME